jgi:molybdenum cofactor guanylyltransferase
MIFMPGMLMIGAAGRKAGKTQFACGLIKKFSSQHSIIGIKVTSIDGGNKGCHRGATDCSVCARLEGAYEICEETDRQNDKDTGRMLASGADRVFWLRCEKTHLEQGMAAVLEIIGNDTVSICESNSLRAFVKPGVFVIVTGTGDICWKESARDVVRYADRIVSFDGKDFDFRDDMIQLKEGKWVCRMQATAIIMAGGDSRRMGEDKSMLPLGGQPLIKRIYDQIRPHFDQIIISTNAPEKHGFLGAEIVSDKVSSQGPLMGIFSALEASANEANLVVACDIPRVDMALVKRMIRERCGADIVVPRYSQGRIEPLFGVYCRSALTAINQTLEAGKRKIADAFGLCRIKYIDLDSAEELNNLNTMADYIEFADEYNADAG